MFQQLRAAKAWGLTPRDWRAETEDDRALMMALNLFEGTLEARRSEWRESKRAKEKSGETSENEFQKMKERMRKTT